jgi:hypothetical protein
MSHFSQMFSRIVVCFTMCYKINGISKLKDSCELLKGKEIIPIKHRVHIPMIWYFLVVGLQWPWRICPLHNIETPYDMYTHEVVVINLRWDNLMLVILCISSDNLMILYTLLLVALSWGLRRSGLQVCWSCKELTYTQFGITPKIVCPTTCQT